MLLKEATLFCNAHPVVHCMLRWQSKLLYKPDTTSFLAASQLYFSDHSMPLRIPQMQMISNIMLSLHCWFGNNWEISKEISRIEQCIIRTSE